VAFPPTMTTISLSTFDASTLTFLARPATNKEWKGQGKQRV